MRLVIVTDTWLEQIRRALIVASEQAPFLQVELVDLASTIDEMLLSYNVTDVYPGGHFVAVGGARQPRRQRGATHLPDVLRNVERPGQ